MSTLFCVALYEQGLVNEKFQLCSCVERVHYARDETLGYHEGPNLCIPDLEDEFERRGIEFKCVICT